MHSPSVVVIGAGPAGSTAARQTALQGAHVTLVEARRLPRDKTCAGGVTPKARQLLPDGVLGSGSCTVHRFELRGGRLPPYRFDEPAAEVVMVERASFDNALVEAAAAVGADVLDGEPATQVTEHEDRVEVRTRRATMDADYVVVADGFPSRVAHDLGLGQVSTRRSLALSCETPLSSILPPDLAVISFSVAGGYAWYFPKGDHANVGVGGVIGADRKRQAVDEMRDALASLATRSGFDVDRAGLKGHWVPHGISLGALASRRCVLVGDAAGMADPLFGEGIAYAIGSGQLAAEAILEVATGRAADLRPYEQRLRNTYGPAMRRLGWAAQVVARSPTLALAATRISARVRSYGVNVVSGLQEPFSFARPEHAI